MGPTWTTCWRPAKLDAGQIDGSYDGSPGRFVAEGNLVQQGFVTNEIYKYENDIAEWMKPVDFLLIHDTGFDIYQSALSVKPETVTESEECLAALVPIFQQSLVDYINDPAPMNERLVEIVTELDTFWTLTVRRAMPTGSSGWSTSSSSVTPATRPSATSTATG